MGGRQTSQRIPWGNSAPSQGQGPQWSDTRDRSSGKAGDCNACAQSGLGSRASWVTSVLSSVQWGDALRRLDNLFVQSLQCVQHEHGISICSINKCP